MRHFSDWIAAYLSLVDGKTEAPRIYSYWAAVSTIAAALTRNVWIDETRYTIYPNFFIVLAGRPGIVKKSTTIDEATNLIRELDPLLFGPNESSWPDIARLFAERTTRRLVGPAHEDPLLDEYETQCAMTLALREFGTFLKPDDTNMINGITELWDCGNTFLKSTKTSGVDLIINPYLNIIGAATAQWLRDNFKTFAGWGIAARIIFVHSDAEPKPIWSPSRIIRTSEWKRYRSNLQEDITSIRSLYGPVSFSPAAAAFAETWYKKNIDALIAYLKRQDADKWVSDFLGRKQVHVHKLAMILSVSRRDTLIIEEEDYRDAVEQVDAVEAEIRRIFAIQITPTIAATQERGVWEILNAELSNGLGRRASKRYLLSRVSDFVDGRTAERILTSFIHRGLLIEEATREGAMLVLSPDCPPPTNPH